MLAYLWILRLWFFKLKYFFPHFSQNCPSVSVIQDKITNHEFNYHKGLEIIISYFSQTKSDQNGKESLNWKAIENYVLVRKKYKN